MEKEFYLLIPAGGRGVRMNAALPKQFLELKGVPVLRYTIERFLDVLPGARVVLALPKDWIPWWKEYCLKNNFNCPQVIVEGGITRFHSVKAALARVPDGAVAAVHDAVRPLVSGSMILGMLSKMDEGTAALVPAVNVADTLKSFVRDEGNLRLSEGPHPDRNEVLAVQTPQMFLSEVLKDAYRLPYDTAYTDDASVVAASGTEVSVFPGDRMNFKLTTKQDLLLAEAVLKITS